MGAHPTVPRDSVPITLLQTPPYAHEAIAAELEVLIRAGHFPEQAHLPSQRHLAERFGVSRPTIRSALSLLESRGLIVVHSGSGRFVPDRADEAVSHDSATADDHAEFLVARLTIEVAVTKLAARRALSDPDGLERLRRAVEALERVADPDQIPIDLDVDFHRGVAELTGNSYLIRLLEPIWATKRGMPLATLLRRPWTAVETMRTAKEHRAIFESLSVGNAELAGFAMERHLRSLVASIFEDGGFDGTPSRFFA